MPAAGTRKSAASAAKGKKGSGIVKYINDTIGELKKVVWLTRREIAYLTGLVIVVTIITGVILGGLDYAFTQLIGKVFIGGG